MLFAFAIFMFLIVAPIFAFAFAWVSCLGSDLPSYEEMRDDVYFL